MNRFLPIAAVCILLAGGIFLVSVRQTNAEIATEIETYDEKQCYYSTAKPNMFVMPNAYGKPGEDSLRLAVFFSHQLFDTQYADVYYQWKGAWDFHLVDQRNFGEGFAVYITEWFRISSSSDYGPEDTLRLSITGRWTGPGNIELVEELKY